jgi:hypothetical protein
MTMKQLIEELAPMSEDNIKKTVRRMVEDSQIEQPARGQYRAKNRTAEEIADDVSK